jgi:hypothetical protein
MAWYVQMPPLDIPLAALVVVAVAVGLVVAWLFIRREG